MYCSYCSHGRSNNTQCRQVSFKSATANMVVLVQISSELFEYGCMAKLVYMFFSSPEKTSHQSISRHVFLTGKCWIWMDDFQTSSCFQPQKKPSEFWMVSAVGLRFDGQTLLGGWCLISKIWTFYTLIWGILRNWKFEKVFVQDNCSRKTDWLVQLSHIFTHILLFQLVVSLIFVCSCRHHGKTLMVIGADWVFHHLGRQIFTCHSGEWVAWQQD